MTIDAHVFSPNFSDKFGISVVVPLYCSQNSLLEFYERTSAQLSQLTDDWELILVDDCSSDNTWSAAYELHNLDCRVKCIRLARNHGQQHATLCGLGYVQKSFAITIDDDLQCFPEDIPAFIEKLLAGSHVVIGKIASGYKKHHLVRNFASNLNQYLAGRIIGKPKTIRLSSFRAMTLEVAKRLTNYKGAHPHIAAMLFKLVPHALICNVDVRHAHRFDGKSSTYSLRKLIKTLSYLVINHSYIPLRIMVSWGAVISLISLTYSLWVAGRAVMGDYSVPGWTSLAVLVSFLSGNILLALGILGEYLGRLVEESSNIEQFSVFEEQL
jgi:glycosyltransferase involved in cell wall biosynthesis